jgi:hypothetical protein
MAFDTSLICGGIPAGALHKSEHKSKSSHSSDLGFFCALEFLVAIFIASLSWLYVFPCQESIERKRRKFRKQKMAHAAKTQHTKHNS